MNFNSSIRKAAISNHIRNRRLRIKIADNNNPVFKAIVKNKIKGKTILEIGCSTGYLLEALRSKLGAKCFGVDISSAAIKEGKKLFKKIKLYNSFFESSKLKNKKYDLIILGYFLFLLPIDKVLTLFSLIDISLKKNSHLIIYDFHNKKFKKKKYKHNKNLQVYRWDYKKVFLSLPNYKKIKIIKFYNIKMKDYEEISIIKKISI